MRSKSAYADSPGSSRSAHPSQESFGCAPPGPGMRYRVRAKRIPPGRLAGRPHRGLPSGPGSNRQERGRLRDPRRPTARPGNATSAGGCRPLRPRIRATASRHAGPRHPGRLSCRGPPQAAAARAGSRACLASSSSTRNAAVGSAAGESVSHNQRLAPGLRPRPRGATRTWSHDRRRPDAGTTIRLGATWLGRGP